MYKMGNIPQPGRVKQHFYRYTFAGSYNSQQKCIFNWWDLLNVSAEKYFPVVEGCDDITRSKQHLGLWVVQHMCVVGNMSEGLDKDVTHVQ